MAGRSIAFVNTVLLVRWLGPGKYGVYAVLLSLLMVSSSFANLRLDLGLARYLPEFLLRRSGVEKELVKGVWKLGVALGVLTSIGLLAFAGFVATRIYARPELTGYVRLIAPAIALTVIQQMSLSTLAGLQDYRRVAVLQVITSVLQLVASVTGWAWIGLRGAVLGYVVGAGIAALAAAFVARQRLGESGFGTIKVLALSLGERVADPARREGQVRGNFVVEAPSDPSPSAAQSQRPVGIDSLGASEGQAIQSPRQVSALSLGRCGKIDIHGLAHTFRCALSGVLVSLADLKGLRQPSLTQLAFDNCRGPAPPGQQIVAHGVSRGNVDAENDSSPVGAADSQPVLSPLPGLPGRSESFAQGCRLGPHSTGPTGLGSNDATLARLTHFSVGCLFASLISISGYWCGTAILTRYRGFEAAALFSVAYSFGAFTLFAPGYLLGPAVPFLSEAWAAGRLEEFSDLVRCNFRLAVSLTIPIAVSFAVLARPLVSLVYGARLAPAWPAASLLSLAGVFFIGIAVFNLAFTAAERVWESVALNALWLGLFAALSAATAPAWGTAGVGLSFLLSLGVGYGVCCTYGLRRFGIANVGALQIATSVLAFGSCAVWLASLLSGGALWLAGCAVALAVSATFLKAFFSPDELALAWQTISRPLLRWSGSPSDKISGAAGKARRAERRWPTVESRG